MGTYLVMKNNFRKSFSHKILFAITLLLPILLCMMIGSIKIGRTSLRVGILESETSDLQKNDQQSLYKVLEQSEGIKYALAKEDTLHTDLMTGKYHVMLDFRNRTTINDFKLISYQSEEKKIALKEYFKGAISTGESIDLSGLSKPGINETERILAILLSLFMILSTVPTAAIIRDKKNGTYRRYQFALKNSRGYIQGYIIHTFLITLVQVVLCMVVLEFLQKSFEISLFTGVVIGVMIAGISTLFSGIICLVSNSEMRANITASSLAAGMSLLGGTFISIDSMPNLLQIISLASPMRWIVEVIRFM